MTIASAIENAQTKVSNAYTAVSGKGGTLPATQNLSNLPTAINSITELQGETQSVSLTNSSGQTFTPSSNKNGITSITVTPNNQARTVTPTTSQQSLTVNSGYSGNGTITVNAVTSSIDSNITAGNIKNGVSILGVTGSFSGSGYVIETVTLSIVVSYPNYFVEESPTFTIHSGANAITLGDGYTATFSKNASFTFISFKNRATLQVPKSVSLSWNATGVDAPFSGTLNLSDDYTLSLTG